MKAYNSVVLSITDLILILLVLSTIFYFVLLLLKQLYNQRIINRVLKSRLERLAQSQKKFREMTENQLKMKRKMLQEEQN